MAYLGDLVCLGTPEVGTAHLYPTHYRDTFMRRGHLVLHDDRASRTTHSPLLLARSRARARERVAAARVAARTARKCAPPTAAWNGAWNMCNTYSAPWSAREPASARLGPWDDEPPFGARAADGGEP